MNKPFLITISLLVGLVALVCWYFLGKNLLAPAGSVASSSAAEAVVATPSATASAQGIVKSRPSTQVVDDDRPFAEARSDLARQARAGDGRAARRLGMTLANCNRYVPISDGKFENTLVDALASGVIRTNAPPDVLMRKFQITLAQARRNCGNVSGLNEKDAKSKAFDWIELGASLGDADAQAMYASLAFESFDRRNALADAERIQERKRRALDYLKRSLAQGDALALLQRAKFPASERQLPAGAEDAYGYLYAFSLTPRATDFVPGYVELALATVAQGLDSTAQARAQEAGRRLATCCMSVTRGQP